MAVPFTPSFRGSAIFGVAPEVVPSPSPPRFQVTAYPGINGIEVVNLGSSGGTAVADGLLVAADVEALAVLRQTWFNQVGWAGPLLDTTGTLWQLAVCRAFRPAEGIRPALNGGVSQAYQAEFLIIR